LATQSSTSAFLKRELSAAEFASTSALLRPERGIDADQIVGLGAGFQALFLDGSGSGSVLALRIFCAMVSASSVRLMRE
jgi:hypothetical protein